MRTSWTVLVGVLGACRTPASVPSDPVEPGPARVEPTPEPVEPVPASAGHERCWQQGDIGQREACLSVVEPVGAFERAPVDAPLGYICALFIGRGPRCEPGEVRVLGRWREPSACGYTLSLYWAAQQDPTGPVADLGDGRPGDVLEPFVLSSDGELFGYLRLGDYVLESEVCGDRSEEDVSAQLLEWGRLLQPEIHPME